MKISCEFCHKEVDQSESGEPFFSHTSTRFCYPCGYELLEIIITQDTTGWARHLVSTDENIVHNGVRDGE